MTRFAAFARAGDFWVFGDDQAGHLVRVLYEDQFYEIKQSSPEVADFGKFVWLSTLLPDTAVVAVSSAMASTGTRKVEFFKVFGRSKKVFKISVVLSDVVSLDRASFS